MNAHLSLNVSCFSYLCSSELVFWLCGVLETMWLWKCDGVVRYVGKDRCIYIKMVELGDDLEISQDQ